MAAESLRFPQARPVSPNTAPTRRRRVSILAAAALAVAALSSTTHAQIQRGFVNLGFEQPDMGASVCFMIVGRGAIPGWNTTHPAPGGGNPNQYCPPNITAATPGVNTGGQIEMWANSFNGVPALNGKQHAELNAYQTSRLFQSVCLINGETLGYSIGHRGRGSASAADVAEFNIDSAANTVFRASTTSNGTGGVVQCGSTVVAATDGPVAGAADGLVATPNCSSATATNGWRRYTGTFVWNGTNGVHDFGFESISAAGGAAAGNFMDDVGITLRPVVEFSATGYASREGAASPVVPQLLVVGTVPAGGIPISITVTPGTATLGSDYTTTPFTIPAGDYQVPTPVPLTGLVTVINDTIIEDNETVQLQLEAGNGYVVGSTSVCNNPATTPATFTILDNDVDTLTTKTVANANPPAGGNAVFTVTYQNNTARTVFGDTTMHDATVNLADALPAGFVATSWTCAAGGTPAPTCPAASGTGAIATAATLPAGNGAAGGTLTYTVTGTLGPAQCAAVTNTSTVATTGAVAEGTAAQAGFTTPVPGGTANNSASAGVDPGCLTLNKTTLGTAGGPFAFVLTNTVQTTGTATTVTAGTPVQVDGNAAAGIQPFGIAASGTAVTIDETPLPANFQLSTATCTSGAGTIGSLAGTTYTIPAVSVTPGTDIACTYTNRRVRTVAVNKTLSPASDTGVFNLQVDGSNVATNVGNGGSGSNAAVSVGATVTVAELGGTGTALAGYASTLTCAGVAGVSGTTSGSFTMPDNNVTCTFANTAIVNIAIAKTAVPNGTYLPGQPLVYTIVVTNNGPRAATGISVTDTVPASVAVATWTCAASGAGADCDAVVAGTGASGTGNAIALNAVALGSGESVTITVNGTVALATTGSIVNTAAASPPAGATCASPPCTVSSTTTNGDAGTPQLALTKTATPAAFSVGQTGTYTLQVGNAGSSSTAGAITISDPLPAGITTTATPSGAGWNCAASTSTVVSCTTSAVLLPGSNAPPVSVPVAIAAGTASPAVNTATASGGGDTSCPAATRCNATTTTPVNAPRLDVVKSLSGSFVVGVQTTYVITVTNNGTAPTVAGGTIGDTIPTGLTIGTLPAGCTAAVQVVTCTIPAGLAPGASVSFVTPVTPQAAALGQSLTNSATVSGGGDPTCPADSHCTGTTTDVVEAPQLSLIKSATPSTFVVGQPATYTLTVTNTGTAATTAVTTVTDTIPGGLAIGALPVGCSASGQVVTCTIAAGLATGTPVSFAIPVTPAASLVGMSVVNDATVAGGGDPSCPVGAPNPPARCSDDVTTPVEAPQLTIAKNASGANFVVGVPASYTIAVTNTGTAATTSVATISDLVPADLTLGTMPAGCSAAGQQVTCSIPAGLAVGAVVSFVIPVTPLPSANGQTLANTATVVGGGDPSCPGETHCSSTTTTPVNAPSLQLAKTASGSNFVVGVAASYTLTVTNTGTAPTTQPATVNDTIPGSLTLGAMPAGCTNAGQVVTCTIPAGLAVGAVTSFVIPVTPQASANGTTVSNTATVSGGGDPDCPAAAECTDTTNTPVDAPRLTIAKTASGANFVVGVPASYTLTVTNVGTAPTTAVTTISDTIPGDLAIGTLPAGCSAAGQLVTCTIAAGLATGAPVAFVIPVTPLASASGQTLANAATVSGGGDPACPGAPECDDTTNTPVDAPRLTIEKTASGANFVVGVPASYTLTVTNVGTAATTAVTTISDTIPGGLTLGTMPAGCSAAGQVVTCTIAAGLATGAPVGFVIPVTPLAAASGQTLANAATVSGGGDPACPGAPECEDTTNTPIDAPKLTVAKVASSASFVVGVPASYTITVTNTGTAATTAPATVSDTMPAGLTLGTMPAGCTASGQVVTCTVPAGLATGALASFTIPVTPQASASGTTVTNSATVSGGGDPTCPGADDCTSTTDTPVDAPQLSIAKTASATSFVVGVPASYTITVTNTGTAATTQPATVSDAVPAGLLIGAVPAGCTASGQTVTCTIAAGLSTGAPVSFVIPVTPLASANGSTLVNSATVSGGGDPTCPQAPRCTGVVQTPVNAPALSVAKTASSSAFVVGVPASYTLTVTNIGSAATTAAATISDTVPAGLTLGPMPAGCSASGQVVTCTVAAGLAAGASAAFAIPVTPTPATSGTTVTNSATVSGGGDPACPSAPRCTGTVDVPINAPQLTLVKTASTATFVVNQQATYTLTVTNTGSAATTAVATVSDPIPSSLTPGTMPVGCTASGQLVTCTVPAGLAPGASVAFDIPVVPTQAAAGATIVNTATVTGGGDPSCPGAMHCTGTTTVQGAGADLAIVKTHAGDVAVRGGTIVYTLTVTNAGPSDAQNPVVVDPLPAGLVYVGATGTGWACAEAGGVVTCNAATLAAGATSPITLTLSVPVSYSGTGAIANVATVSSSTPDPNPANNTGTDTVPLSSATLPVPTLGAAALACLMLVLVLAAARRRRTA